MGFNLIDGGRNLRVLQQILGRFNSEIANTDTADLARGHKLLQSSPCVGDRDVGYEEPLRHRVRWREGFVCVLEGDGPVDLCVVSAVSVVL